MNLLSTKILDQNTIDLAKSMGFAVDCADFIEIKKHHFSLPTSSEIDTVLFTSPNGVVSFFQNDEALIYLKNKFIISIDGKTTNELKMRGINPAKKGKNGAELAQILVASNQFNHILHPCSNIALTEIGDELKKTDKSYTQLVVYSTITRKEVVDVNKYHAVLFFSPSGVDGFVQSNNLNTNSLYCCIGKTTQEALLQHNNSLNTVIPEKSSPKEMIIALDQYFKNR